RRGEEDAIGWFKGVRCNPIERLIELCEWVFEKDIHPDKKCHRNTGNYDHPWQELAVTIPFAEGDQRCERCHQPGPEENRTSLSTPPGSDLEIHRHGPARHLVDELDFIMV